ncbi:MAG: RagB/SusD family nutrient uptake outer membrane protein [Tannerellaceae bacterium]|nr:RagB/SusD family nutrient uptake outer membrane protein [Tannerellaceae bacterium]
MKRIFKNRFIILLVFCFGLFSCSDDFLNPDVSEYATGEQINDLTSQGGETVVALMNSIISGAYNAMITYQDRHDAFGQMSTGFAADLMTEDVAINYVHQFIFDYQIGNNAAAYARTVNTWNYLYSVVSKCNEVIAAVSSETTDSDLKKVLGQALALRSYAYLQLVQRYQQTYIGNEDKPAVPLTLTANDDRESIPSRATAREVYDKLLVDLEDAVNFLDGFSRPNKTIIDQSVASGIYARLLIVVEDWPKAAQYAKLARTGYSLMSQNELKVDGFNEINNKEWLWGADITGETTTMFASFFSHVCSYDEGYGQSNFMPKMMDARLYSQMGSNDARKAQFKDPSLPVDIESDVAEENAPSYCNFKFKKVTGWLADYVYMRASEMYLIEAEALARQGKGAEAYVVMKEYMDNRDPDWAVGRSSVTAEDVFLQKRLELWAEGHIFYDYLRFKKGVNRDYAGSNHLEKLNIPAGSWKFIYQLPQFEIDNNVDLSEADQNPLE